MPVPSLITDLSQTAGSNYPSGGDSPSTLDDVQRAHASFIALLRDGKGQSAPVSLASAATVDIGAQNSQFVEITGTTGITSFGTTYNGPRYLRFQGALTLTHNTVSLSLPTGANITTAAGDTCVVVPNQALNGWTVVAYAGKSGQFATITANGGAINGATIGATTPSTGAFTTLSATGDITGTTNATYYRSKAFTGENVRMLGITASNAAYVGPIDTGPTSTYLNGSSTSTTLYVQTGGTTRGQFDSTGLAVTGTITAGGTGVAASDIFATTNATGLARVLANANGAAALALVSNFTGSTSSGVPTSTVALATGQNYPIVFVNNATEKMRLDTSGNLGLGVTPSAWYSTYKGFQIGLASSLYANTGAPITGLAANSLVNSSGVDTYITTATATKYLQLSGQHQWFTAPSGTAGNAITFTQAMTLDASGTLDIAVRAKNAPLADNDLSFDMAARNNFTCTPTAGGTLTFTNITAGQSGFILLVNNSNYAIAAAATTKVESTTLSKISATGTYLLSYFSNGTNVYVSASGAMA